MIVQEATDIKVACENCHTGAPHRGDEAEGLNAHTARIACQTCHIFAALGYGPERVSVLTGRRLRLRPRLSQPNYLFSGQNSGLRSSKCKELFLDLA